MTIPIHVLVRKVLRCHLPFDNIKNTPRRLETFRMKFPHQNGPTRVALGARKQFERRRCFPRIEHVIRKETRKISLRRTDPNVCPPRFLSSFPNDPFSFSIRSSRGTRERKVSVACSAYDSSFPRYRFVVLSFEGVGKTTCKSCEVEVGMEA